MSFIILITSMGLAFIIGVMAGSSWENESNTPKQPVGPPPDVKDLFKSVGPWDPFNGLGEVSREPRGGSFRDRFPHSGVGE